MRTLPAVVVPAVLIALTGCSGGEGRPVRTGTVTASVPAPVRVTVTTGSWTAATVSPGRPAPSSSRPASATTTPRAPSVDSRVVPPPATRPAPGRVAPPPTARATGPAAGGVTVPNLVGDSLTAAYAVLTDLGVPRGRRSPHDISGEGRTVLNPDNWRVCTQKPKPGTRASAQTVYQFGVVKFGERCRTTP